MTIFHGSTTEVYREENSTAFSLLYSDLDKRELRTERLKLKYLSQNPSTNTSKLAKARKAQLRRAKNGRLSQTSSTSRRKDPYPHCGDNKSNSKSRQYKNWTDPGLFHLDGDPPTAATRTPRRVARSPGQQSGTRSGQG